MRMRNYWIKIAAGALGIFAVGLLAVFGFRRVKSEVTSVTSGTGDISIPLMGVIPFSVTGDRIGSLRKIQIHRDAPKHVSGFRLVARLDDSVDSDRFSDCYFTVPNATAIDEHTTFTCLDSIPAGMREFGDVEFVDGDDDEDLTRPIVLTDHDIADFQNANGHDGNFHYDIRGDSARINADSIRAAAESVGEAGRRMGDSIRRVMEARYGRHSGGTIYAPTRPDPKPPVPPSVPTKR